MRARVNTSQAVGGSEFGSYVNKRPRLSLLSSGAPDVLGGVNEVSYLLLEVIDEMHLLQPSSNIQLSAKNPDRFLTHACGIIREGAGPAVRVQRRHGRRGAAAARHARLRGDGR